MSASGIAGNLQQYASQLGTHLTEQQMNSLLSNVWNEKPVEEDNGEALRQWLTKNSNHKKRGTPPK
jgi:hypothetical protein